MTDIGSSLLLPLAAVAVLLSWTTAGGARRLHQPTVLHTNDVHGRFEQIHQERHSMHRQGSQRQRVRRGHCEAEGTDNFAGGRGPLATPVKQTIDSGANVLFLNSGDYYQGSIWFYILGPPIVVDAVNYLKHDAMVRLPVARMAFFHNAVDQK
ncbi:hypothetical protein HPB48_019784 [Haemaphysalis longicornis]|uniref:5'-nucleotidase n=1 Tax=Haemaphysalis longicornis TaxID=44386 RepID=A0A9J6H5V9_HAELO|nr:hypothetical protein HPB48_019784 [Haemaphysalis longicornis]